MDSMNCVNGAAGCCCHHHHHHLFMAIFALAIVIDLVIKGFALWRAAKNDEKGWFVVLLILNTVGILPLIYLFLIDKKKKVA